MRRKMSKKLPKISIITPSYNQAQFIERTIQSVLSQNYPYLEYMVMDGGSTDGTIAILKKYKEKIIWFSEKDKGQSQAINKALKIATGEIVGYLNSDDYLEDNALLKVGRFFSHQRDAYWLTGKCYIVDKDGRRVRSLITLYKNIFLKYLRYKFIFYIIQFISQPATFWKREVISNVGYFDESLDYDMDYDYWLRLWQKYRLYYLDDYLASYRIHEFSKAMVSPETQFEMEYRIASHYSQSKIILSLHKLHSKLALLLYKIFFTKFSETRKI